MSAPLLAEVLPDLLEELAYLLRQAGAAPLVEQLRGLRIEATCDCGGLGCASFATAAEVKVAAALELQASEGCLIVDLDAAERICFIEVLERPDVKCLLEEYYGTG